MQIVRKALADLRAHPRNPRRISKEAMAALEASLSEFDLVEPLIWNKRTDYVLGGHQRLAVLRKRGEKSVDVSVVDLDEKRELALMAVLNKPSGEFTADVDALIGEMGAELRKSLGLDALLNGGRGPKETVVEDVAPPPPKKPISKTGDLWLLGGHRLLCGDSTKAEDVARLMGKERAVLMATDPPYGVDYEGGSGNSRKRARMEGDDSQSLYRAFLPVACNLVIREATPIYLWFADRKGRQVYEAISQSGFTIRSLIVWRKLSAHFGAYMAQYKQDHEPCLYAVRDAPPWFGSTVERAVWEIAQPGVNELHPTQKPVELFAIPIRNHTREGEIVYEPFSGSGTQIVAAEQLKRRCYAIEIAPQYVDVAVLRWQALTDKKATNEKTGKPFGA